MVVVRRKGLSARISLDRQEGQSVAGVISEGSIYGD